MPRPKNTSFTDGVPLDRTAKVCTSGYYETADGTFRFAGWDGDYVLLKNFRNEPLRYHKDVCKPATRQGYL